MDRPEPVPVFQQVASRLLKIEPRPSGSGTGASRSSERPLPYGLASTAIEIQPGQCPRAGRKLVGFDPQSLKHAEVQVAQGRGVLRIEGQVLAMLEAAPRQQDRQV